MDLTTLPMPELVFEPYDAPAPNLCTLPMDEYDCSSGLFHDSVNPLGFLSQAEQDAFLKSNGHVSDISTIADSIGPPLE